MEEILYRFNPWWDGNFTYPGTPRKSYLTMFENIKNTKDIVLVTGLRRVGKTTLIHQFIHHLLEKVESKKIFYVSLDNFALKDYSILEIVDEFRKISSIKHDEHIYLFLDEVHFKENFEIQLKNLYDMGNSKIFALGSASLDIVMKSPYLTGRQRIIKISPLSFNEYLKFTNKEISIDNKHLYSGLTKEYIETGGMPEYVIRKDPNILQSLLESILYRDIAGRYNLRNKENLKDILMFIAQSVSSPISIRKISNILGIKEETVQKILNLFVESNLIHFIEKDGKLSERKVSPKKIYLADTGMFTILTEKINFGACVENLVYLQCAKSSVVRYYRNKGEEVDFILGKKAVESKYKSKISEDDISPIKKLRGFKSKIVVTKDYEEIINGVECIPLWKFLLNEDL